MASTRDVSIDMDKILVDDSASLSTSDLSGVDSLPLADNNELVGETKGLCMDNGCSVLQYPQSEGMCIDELSPDSRKGNYKITQYNSPLIGRASRSVKRSLIREINFRKTEFDQTFDDDIIVSDSLGTGLSNTTLESSSGLDIMVIDSPPGDNLGNNNTTHYDLTDQGINSLLKDEHNSDVSKNLFPDVVSVKYNDVSETKKEEKQPVYKGGDIKKRVIKEFTVIKKCTPSTSCNSRNSGLCDFLGSPRVRNVRLIGSPVGRKLDFDSLPKSSTPKRYFEKMNNTEPGQVLQSTPMDLFLPRRCNSEEILRIDKSRLHLWVNPFSPAGRTIISDIRNVQEKTRRKRNDESFGDDKECHDLFSPKKRKRSSNSRYELEFAELEQIGNGEHGCVYKCLNFFNGLIYAIKISKNKVKRGYALQTAQNELYAHGVLEHKNIVRNYSSWVEDGYVYIQNEYCNRGNLESYMKKCVVVGNKAKKLMYDIASALRYMHNLRLVHLDVKPGNIFVHEIEIDVNDLTDSDSEEESEVTHIIFKLGDFGHIIHLDNLRNLEEGDCRYMARELLNEDKTDLTKADIFSLALSVYEAAGGGGGVELPKNGDEWHLLRDGGLRYLPSLSNEMNLLLQNMTNPDLTKRPTAAEICKMLAPARKTDKLKEELQSKAQKIAVLEAKQRERNNYIKQLKAQSLKFIQASDDIHTPRCTEKLLGKRNSRFHPF